MCWAMGQIFADNCERALHLPIGAQTPHNKATVVHLTRSLEERRRKGFKRVGIKPAETKCQKANTSKANGIYPRLYD